MIDKKQENQLEIHFQNDEMGLAVHFSKIHFPLESTFSCISKNNKGNLVQK